MPETLANGSGDQVVDASGGRRKLMFGEGAKLLAAQRAASFKAKGQSVGHEIWTRIGAAIKELRRDKPIVSESLH